jgi:hypothetical protein
MKKLMSIAAIALFMTGAAALACDTCGCQAKKAECEKKSCSAQEKKCDKCTAEKQCTACEAKAREAKKAQAGK